MKSFSFRLDSILNYRDYLEKRAQIELFKANQELSEKEEAIKRLNKKRLETAKKCSSEGFKGLDVHKYQMYKSFLKGIDLQIEKTGAELSEAEDRVSKKKTALKKESIRKKTLQSLKDLQIEKHKMQYEKEEQKVMDELVLIRREKNI